MKHHSQKFLQKRRLAIVLPLLITPFLTMLFWALGGGAGSPAHANDSETKAGLNLQLPDAHFSKEALNKLALYDKAQRDSMKHKEERENDPYFDLKMLGDSEPVEQFPSSELATDFKNAAIKNQTKDPNVLKVNGKLEELYRELNKKPGEQFTVQQIDTKQKTVPDSRDLAFSSDVEKLGGMMEMMSRKKTGEDPEMNRISGMLDKILDVQHPERMRERIREQSRQSKGKVFTLSPYAGDETIGLMGNRGDSVTGNRSVHAFYGMEDEVSRDTTGNSIEAVIHDTQELVTGATVKLRLTHEVYLNGIYIPKDQFIYGVANINGERLSISITSVRYNDSLFPVSLSAYDLDGIEGVYVPGAITRDVAKQSGDQAVQGMQFMTMDQSVGAQAASAGMQAAKGLFSKKVKLIKVTVKAGYMILLKDSNNQK